MRTQCPRDPCELAASDTIALTQPGGDREHIEEIAGHFYRHLFTVHPELLVRPPHGA
jgi:hypothetical protein